MATSVETAAEHERILREIESTDTNCIGPTLRSVYDGREHGLFVEKLDVRIRNHDREIEKMCNHHFQGFVDSITELLKVRGEAQKLKSQVTETNRHLQDEGKELMGSMEELQKCRVQQRNIASTIDKLTHCLPVLEMYSRLQEQMRAKSFLAFFTLSTLVPGAQDLVDFSPVYRCLHIYTVLGLRDVFENYYRKQRRKQARLVLQPHSNMHETLEGYTRYFNQIVGFFVVEDHILHTTQGLVNRAYVEELWELALSKLIAALRTHSSYCDNPNLVLDLKNLIGYGFPVSQLFDMLLEMREQYGEILLKKWNITFRQVLDQDNFSPIPVSTEQEYKNYTSQFPLQDPELDKLPFPKKLPFSEFVPKVYCQLKEFIYACLKRLHASVSCSNTKQTVLYIQSSGAYLASIASDLTETKSVVLVELADAASMKIVIINTTHLEQSCHFLEEFISNITNVPPDSANATKLYGMSTFKDARHSAEAEIYTNLNAKIDQFLQLAEYDWMVALQGGGTSEASDYLMDLIAFLN
ncbi:Exocyst complex component 6B, partial [Dissostichus eleginoides]